MSSLVCQCTRYHIYSTVPARQRRIPQQLAQRACPGHLQPHPRSCCMLDVPACFKSPLFEAPSLILQCYSSYSIEPTTDFSAATCAQGSAKFHDSGGLSRRPTLTHELLLCVQSPSEYPSSLVFLVEKSAVCVTHGRDEWKKRSTCKRRTKSCVSYVGLLAIVARFLD